MTDILAELPDASAISIECMWRMALTQELGLVVDIDPALKVESVMNTFYSTRQKLLELDPTLPLLDFYITLPKDQHSLVIVREPKATLE